MKQLKSLFSLSKGQVIAGVVVAGVVTASPSFAAGIDFSSLSSGVDSSTAITVIVAMGVVKLGPNFAKWAVNKVASFF
ncbi:hypothetical protein QNM99_16995 [Pseudomonas sp. PCH446]